MRTLDRAKIKYEHREYEPDATLSSVAHFQIIFRKIPIYP